MLGVNGTDEKQKEAQGVPVSEKHMLASSNVNR